MIVEDEDVTLFPLDDGWSCFGDLVEDVEVGDRDDGAVAVEGDGVVAAVVAEERGEEGVVVLCTKEKERLEVSIGTKPRIETKHG
jgi:hypothetical protein